MDDNRRDLTSITDTPTTFIANQMALFWTLLWLPLYAVFHCYIWVRSVGDTLSSPLWLAIDQGHCFCDHYTTEGDRLHLQGYDQRPVWEPSGSVFLRRIIDMHSHRHKHIYSETKHLYGTGKSMSLFTRPDTRYQALLSYCWNKSRSYEWSPKYQPYDAVETINDKTG